MRTRNKLFTLFALSAAAVATTALINKSIKMSAISKNLLSQPESNFYKWRLGNIYYTKTGVGKPLLLIHDLTPASSGYEWNELVGLLSEHYTVYVIDLLGCGRSEKPNLTYTNYLYVQLISDFIKSEIGHRTNVIATGASAPLAIMACNNDSDLFEQLMLIRPDSILSSSQIPSKYAKSYKFILDLPIIGTLLYHISTTKKTLQQDFRLSGSALDAYYESANLGLAPKSIYASVKCNYTKCNILNALKKIDNSICLVGGSSTSDFQDLADEYREYNSAIECFKVQNSKDLPQFENPTELLNTIKLFFA